MDEVAVMAEVAAGSGDALATVYQRLGPSVRAVGRRIVGDAGADDVVQETFERVWRHAARFDRQRGSLDAWVLRIARNAALGQLRRVRPHVDLAVVPEPVDASGEPGDAVVLIDLTTGVRRAVAGLEDRRRVAVEHVLAGHTLVQTAGHLGVPEGTLKSRVRAAYADLRAVLAASRTA
ncbi:MAG: RNA polymerase sigma factor [Acidimicrobiia bacterium]|nr:RNA polymerase sigma factor [Acidimicrobiia bacterium]